MNRQHFFSTLVVGGAIVLSCVGVAHGQTPSDGMYVGTTDQGRDFELRVTGGQVDQWYINIYVSCMYGSASGGVRTTISPACTIAHDGSFVCGSVSCPIAGFSSEVGGVFENDDTVSGTVEVAVRIGPGCCYGTVAFDAALLAADIFADGFESGNCAEWSSEFP